MEINLRDYQELLKKQVYESLNNNNRIIAQLQTGGGKTICFMSMIKDFILWGAYVVVVMRRRSLINQTYLTMDSFDIDHGVYMANHHRYAPTKKVQLCSIDTLGSRNVFPHCNEKNVIVILDESHDVVPSGKKYSALIEAYEGSKVIGFTATPFSNNFFFTDVVCPISAKDLMLKGYLTPAKAFVPDVIDVSNVSIKKTGQFDERELFEACSGSKIVKDIVGNWKKRGGNKRTILFAVNIEHSKMLCQAFNDAGIKSVHCDKDTKDKDRRRILQKLKNDEIKILCNINVFSTGLDLVEIECIIFARPTRSEIFYLQAIGRGLRPAEHIGKTHCTIIDSAGNWLRFGSPYKDREVILGNNARKTKEIIEDINVRTCKQCFLVFKATEQACPECGFINPKIERKGYEEVEGELVERKLTEEELEQIKLVRLKKKTNQLYWVQKKNPKLTIGFIGSQLNKDFGTTYIDKNFLVIDKIIEKLTRRYK